MGRISVPAYAALGRVLDPTGPGVTFSEIDDVVIPTQDLSRVLQRSQVRHFVYHLNQDLTGDVTTSVQWGDASDWTEISADNIVLTLDSELPAADGSQDRLLTGIGLFVSDNPAEWVSSLVRRVPALATAQVTYAWSALSAARLAGNAVPAVPNLLPIVIAPGEATIELDTDITFVAGVTLDWIIEMMVAPQGVMASYPGV